MIRIISVNKVGNKIQGYTCTDGSRTENLTKEQIVQQIKNKNVENAKVQLYNGNYRITDKVTKEVLSSKKTNTTKDSMYVFEHNLNTLYNEWNTDEFKDRQSSSYGVYIDNVQVYHTNGKSEAKIQVVFCGTYLEAARNWLNNNIKGYFKNYSNVRAESDPESTYANDWVAASCIVSI